MSVIVKGMEMPVSGTKYRVVEDLEGNKYLTLYGIFDGQYYPISPLPEKHGRLIDADELEDVFYSFHHSQSAGYVQDAETIVEAEGGSE